MSEITETSGNQLVQHTCSEQLEGQLEQVFQAIATQVLNTSKTGDSTTSMGNLWQGLMALTVKMVFSPLCLSLFSCQFQWDGGPTGLICC